MAKDTDAATADSGTSNTAESPAAPPVAAQPAVLPPTVIQVMQPEALPPTKGLNETVAGGRFLLPVGDNLVAVNCNGERLDGGPVPQMTGDQTPE